MELSIGYSPCPNDTFIFDAMVHGKVDTEGLSFNVYMADVEELNQMAFREELDITKLSYHAFAYVSDMYALLNSGSALGRNCGPLLVALPGKEQVEVINNVAIPGKYTTANFLLSLYMPQLQNKSEFLFSDIEDAVIKGKYDAGLIIHENRFTYQEKGLVKVADLGKFWESLTAAPIPLGGIAVNRSVAQDIQDKIDRVIKRSVEYAFTNPDEPKAYIKEHAQAMSEEVMYKHIELYVNEYTIELGKEGRKAVETLYNKASELNLIPLMRNNIFVS